MPAQSHTLSGPSEEEYILLADYNTDAVGELSLSAGDVVQLINRETTGEPSKAVAASNLVPGPLPAFHCYTLKDWKWPA